MEAFTQLLDMIDAATDASEKVAALTDYFRQVPAADAGWALRLLSKGPPARFVKPARLRLWAAEAAGLPLWLIEECLEAVGDLAETLAFIVPPPASEGAETEIRMMQGAEGQGGSCAAAATSSQTDAPVTALHRMVQQRLLPLGRLDETGQRELLLATWAELDPPQRLVWNRLVTGTFRVGVSRALLARALACLAGVHAAITEYRLMGGWQPSSEDFTRLVAPEAAASEPARPYPFHLASLLERPTLALGDIPDWQIEWKWGGLRAQLIRRASQCILWSHREEILTDAFPEIATAASVLPDGTVLDGALLAWRGEGLPAPTLPQRRLSRRKLTRLRQAEMPPVFLAFDLLERGSADWRGRPLAQRREGLERVIEAAQTAWKNALERSPTRSWQQGELFGLAKADAPDRRTHSAPAGPCPLRLSPILKVMDWGALPALHQQARSMGTGGLLLKRLDSTYGIGRQPDAWWKWNVAPFVCAAVLVAAQPGRGPHGKGFTNGTFAVWHNGDLVPVAKAPLELTAQEIEAVGTFVGQHTTGRFGPVRAVKPELVFELAFTGVQASCRHKSGLTLRLPRVTRWRRDKEAADADHLATLEKLLATGG